MFFFHGYGIGIVFACNLLPANIYIRMEAKEKQGLNQPTEQPTIKPACKPQHRDLTNHFIEIKLVELMWFVSASDEWSPSVKIGKASALEH